MQSLNLTGSWKGFYEYGAKYSKLLRGKQVEFFLNLISVNDEFSGECIDVSEDYRNNMTAEVKGFIRENLISFIKSYPHHHITKEDGSKAINYNKQHPEIEYTGYYNNATGKFKGEWLMVTRNIVTKHDYSPVIPYNNKYYNSDRYEMKLKEYSCAGTWEIEKVDI